MKDAAPASQAAKRRPIDSVRVDDVSGAIWSREIIIDGHSKTAFSATFERGYVDKTGTRKWTGFFDPDSFGKLLEVIQKADERIRMLQDD